MEDIGISNNSAPSLAAPSRSSFSAGRPADQHVSADGAKAAEQRGLTRGTSTLVAILIGAAALILFSLAAAHLIGSPNVADLSAVFAAATT